MQLCLADKGNKWEIGIGYEEVTEWLHNFVQMGEWPILKIQSYMTTFDQEIDFETDAISIWSSWTQVQKQDSHG